MFCCRGTCEFITVVHKRESVCHSEPDKSNLHNLHTKVLIRYHTSPPFIQNCILISCLFILFEHPKIIKHSKNFETKINSTRGTRISPFLIVKGLHVRLVTGDYNILFSVAHARTDFNPDKETRSIVN